MPFIHVPTVFDHEPSTQEIFDAACRHFAAQKRQSKIGHYCLYRMDAENGDKCACGVGHFIPDYAYSPYMERHDVHHVTKYNGVPPWFINNINFLLRLQVAHDQTSDLDGLKRRLTSIAEDLGLNGKEIEQITEFSVVEDPMGTPAEDTV